jgi:hypothetical protein
MFVRPLLTSVIVASLGFASSALAAGTAATHKPGDQVHFCGTVIALTEGGCIGVMSNGETFEITSASPKPAVGARIAGAGTVNNEATICQEGVHLNPVTWSAAKLCPVAEDSPSQY